VGSCKLRDSRCTRKKSHDVLLLAVVVSEQLPLKMVVIHVQRDDHTYVDGDMECELDENGDGIEPFIYKKEEGDVTVECYVSKYLYIERAKGGEITKVVHTCTCWSDDWDAYTIQNEKVVGLVSTEHGMNRVYINYTNGAISKIEYPRREFGCFKIGDHAPDLDDLIAKHLELLN
jgi:hypothetical protein